MIPKIAYIDESGNHDLDTEKAGASSYFIVCAIIVDAGKNERFLIEADEIRARHFQSSEMKSSKVRAKDDHKRRIKILDDLLSLDFTFYALAVDKKEIYKDGGYQYKKSFVKNLNGKVYGSLFQHYADIRVLADETGDQEFSKSMKAYVENNHVPDLFFETTFELVSSSDYVGVQIADFVAGTLAQVYEGKSGVALREKYLELIKLKSVGVDEWPIKFSPKLNADTHLDKFDTVIMQYAFNQAAIFLEKNRNNHDDETKMQVCALDFLLFQSHWNNAQDYVPTHAIMSHLRESGYGKVSEQILRSSVIAKLRDADVLIASSNKGYKIPREFKDMYDFAAKVDSQVVPQLRRLNKARKSILMATSNELDILKGPDFPNLVAFIDSMKE
ncbi:MAG: DUF3800 domain-containing protein [Gammaproteobacteria bacterium]|nr:DUF3800 domain-containing protein [Gammaproteobacteria bacterium]